MKKIIPLLYVGRRWMNDGRMWDCFLEKGDPKKPAYYSHQRRRFCQIGDWYQGTSTGKDLCIPNSTPDECSNQKPPTEEQIQKWEREDSHASIQQSKKQAANKARKRVDQFKSSSYHTLKKACKNLSYWEAREFIGYLVSELQKDKK